MKWLHFINTLFVGTQVLFIKATMSNNVNFGKEMYFEQFKIVFINKMTSGILLKVVEFSFVLPGSNAAVERVFSLMNSTWTNSRNKLDIKMVEATLSIKTRFNNKSCEVFYDQILGNKSLLNQIHGSANYVGIKIFKYVLLQQVTQLVKSMVKLHFGLHIQSDRIELQEVLSKIFQFKNAHDQCANTYNILILKLIIVDKTNNVHSANIDGELIL
ncbi:protein FAM200B-like [Aphis craccivora]|uniref:Protein FAM200B-like n=1 Tax=Aphis craccivora TaxID=307492 RepID=A0A6G0ZKV5_APHCR|nr:protein FAM200B-like [Aphis craccivora]